MIITKNNDNNNTSNKNNYYKYCFSYFQELFHDIVFSCFYLQQDLYNVSYTMTTNLLLYFTAWINKLHVFINTFPVIIISGATGL